MKTFSFPIAYFIFSIAKKNNRFLIPDMSGFIFYEQVFAMNKLFFSGHAALEGQVSIIAWMNQNRLLNSFLPLENRSFFS